MPGLVLCVLFGYSYMVWLYVCGLVAANSCLLLLVGNLGDGAVKLRESTLLSFVVRQCQMQRSFSNKYLETLLTLTHRVSTDLSNLSVYMPVLTTLISLYICQY